MPDVSVIVPARDAERTILRTLSAVAEQQAPGANEVILVDNGSLDATASLAEESGLTDQLIRRKRGEGAGAARNAGAAAARGQVLAFVDSDCWPAAGWLAAGIAATDHADLVQGRVLPDPEVRAGPFDRTLAVTGAHGLFESANLFMRRELFLALGGFPAGLERRGAPFGEDVIFGWKARRAGARTSFCTQALVYHEVSSRGPAGFIGEHLRAGLFPPLVQQVPELRREFLYKQLFLTPRSAKFDLALGGLAVAWATQRRSPLAGVLPYLWLLAGEVRQLGPRTGSKVCLTKLAADAVAAVALLGGVARTGSVVL